MKAVLKETKRIMAVLLSVAMIFAYVPETVFTYGANVTDETVEQMPEETSEQASEQIEEPSTEAPSEEPTTEAAPEIEEEAGAQEAGNGAEEQEPALIEDEEGIENESENGATPRTLSITGGNLSLTYNQAIVSGTTAGSNHTVTSTEHASGHTGFAWFIGTMKAGKYDADLNNAVAVAETKDTVADKVTELAEVLDGASNYSSPNNEGKALKDAIAGLNAAKDGAVIKITGTPTAVTTEAKTFYLVAIDNSGSTEQYAEGDVQYEKFTVDVNAHAGVTYALSIPTRETTSPDDPTIQFGDQTDETTPSISAKAGYTVALARPAGSTADNVHPIKLTVANSDLDADYGDYVTAKIVDYDDAATNTVALVQEGDESKKAFTVNDAATATSAKKLGDGQPAEFTIKPAVGLAAKQAGGTEYRAKLVLECKEFGKKEYTLTMTVTNGVGITKVIAHGGDELAAIADGDALTDAYDLGTFAVGETISDVVITAAGGRADMKLEEDITGAVPNGIDTSKTCEALPLGLTGTDNKGTYTITGTVDPNLAAGYLTGTHYFALTPKDANNVSGTKKYFKYTVDYADVEMSIIKKDYSASRAKALTVGSPAESFAWYGKSTDVDTNNFATINIKNNTNSPLVYTYEIKYGKGTDDGTMSTNASEAKLKDKIQVPAKSSASFKIYPTAKSSSPYDANKSLEVTAPGCEDTVIELTYTKDDALKITKPEANYSVTNEYIGTAYFGTTYTYKFEAENPDDPVWTVTNLTDGTATYTGDEAFEALYDVYGFDFQGGVLSGTLKEVPGSGYLEMTVVATSGGSNDTRVARLACVNIENGLTIKSGTTVLDDKTKLVIPEVGTNNIRTVKVPITLINTTGETVTTVKAAINDVTKDGVSLGTPGNYFTVVYDEKDSTRNTYIANTSGLTLGTDSNNNTGAFLLKTNSSLTTSGKYEVKVRVSGDGIQDQDFYAKLTVKDEPVITTYVAGLKANTAVGKDANKKYTAAYLPADPAKFKFELVSGSIPGMQLSNDGFWTGTPTTSGVYEVTVKATTTDLGSDNASGTLTHKVTVAGSNTISVTLAGAGALENTTYVLPGKVKGYTANNSELSLMVKATDDAETDENLSSVTITVADAIDDRRPNDDLDGNGVFDVVEHPENPYKGSSSIINVDKKSIASVTKGQGEALKVTVAAGANAGLYKATVTVSAGNALPVEFDVALVVVDALSFGITPASFTGQIGTALTESDLVLTATGGYKDQTIAWSEKGTDVKDETTGVIAPKFYVTKSAAQQAVASDVTGLLLTAENKTIGDESGEGLFTWVSGTPTAASKPETPYKVNIGAALTALNGTAVNSGSAYLKTMLGRGKALTETNLTSITRAIIPAQPVTYKSFDLTIEQSDKIQITDLEIKGEAGKKASTGDIKGTVLGTSVGNTYKKITKFTYDPVVYGYTASTQELDVTVTGGNSTNTFEATPSLGKKHLSDFTIDPSTATKTQLATGGSVFKIIPKADLAPGEHKDTLTLEGDNFKTVEFEIVFVVEDYTRLATIDNNIDPEETDKTVLAKRIEYAQKIEKGEATKAIEFDPISKGSTSAAKEIAIRNVGNQDLVIKGISEVVKKGSTYVIATSPDLALTDGTSGDVQLDIDGMPMTIQAGKVGCFKVAASPSTIGAKTPYIEITVGDGTATGKNYIYLPVTFTALNDEIAASSIAVTPAQSGTSYITLSGAVEGYNPSDKSLTFTVKNNSTANTDTIKDLDVASSSAKFVVLNKNSAAWTVEDLAKGASTTVIVKPAEGLGVGTHRATITFTAPNMKGSISRNISFTVAKSNSYTFNKVYTGSTEAISGTVAEKLYNSLWFGIADKSTTNTTVRQASSTSIVDDNDSNHDFEVNVDGETGYDVLISFEGKGNSTTNLKTVTGATIKLLNGTKTVTGPTKTMTLTEAEATRAVGTGAVGTTPECFTELTYKFYATITYGSSGTSKYVEKKVDLDNASVVAENADAEGKAEGVITTLVPFGGKIGDVFTAKDLPTAVIDGAVFKNWETGGKKVDKNTSVTADAAYTEATHTYEYSTGSTKVEDDGVKWVWTDNNGSIDAVLNLTDVSGKYDADSLITIDKKTAAVADDSNHDAYDVKTKLNIADNGSVEATCTKGSRNEYEATVVVWANTTSSAQDTATYTFSSTYSTGEKDDAKGHTWGTPSVDWDNPNSDGTFNVTYTCRDDAEKVVVKASVSLQVICPTSEKYRYFLPSEHLDCIA